MALINCSICLNSVGSELFHTGDTVTGIVVLELKRDLKIAGIDFEVVGVSKAQWSRSAPTIPYIKVHSEKQKVLSIKIEDIFREVSKEKKLPAGVHRYPFYFILPEDLPSTFEGSLGKVYYYIKVKSKPASKIRKIVPFIVFGNVNVNRNTELLKPCLHEFQKILSCNSGKIEVTVKTYIAFASKQKVPFEIIISNEKQIKISKIKVSLIQKVRYSVSTGYADKEEKMHKVKYENFSNTIAEVCYFDMEIPQLTPTSLNLTDPMISISYVFRVEVIFPFRLTQQEDIPVTVATTPVVHNEF